MNFSDYIIYADESGDHLLTSIDDDYPIFCLAFCIVKKSDYINQIVPQMQRLKFDFWGHDKIIFHERDIRKQRGDFAFLRADKNLREDFLARLSDIIENNNFIIRWCVIKKGDLNEKYSEPYNPYYIALKFCMEKILDFLKEKEEGKKLYFIFENRGKKEDNLLELEFRRITNNDNSWGYKKCDFSQSKFQIKFSGKHHHSTGLQLVDLIARPIGLSVVKPDQKNRAFDIIKDKDCEGKIFP